MSEILAVLKVRGAYALWVILSCGHWTKWSGPRSVKVKVGQPFHCPGCRLPRVAGETEGAQES